MRIPHPAILAAFVVASAVVLGGTTWAQGSLAPANWDTAVRLAEAPDRNPDPNILESRVRSPGSGMLVLGLFLKPDEFGLHAFYRDRITRAYQGACNPTSPEAADNRGSTN